MKKENDELTDLFRSRLADAQMPVREHFWEELEKDIPLAVRRRRVYLYRFTAAASVLFVLMASSAAFLFFSPKKDIADAFTKVEATVNNGGQLNSDVVEDNFPLINATSGLPKSSPRKLATVLSDRSGDNEEGIDSTLSVTVSMSFSFSSSTYTSRGARNRYQRGQQTAMLSEGVATNSDESSAEEGNDKSDIALAKKTSWSMKLGVGSSLPVAHDLHLPVNLSITLERQLSKHLSLESGLVYSYEQSPDNANLNYLGVPLKLNMMLANNNKFDVYASLGGVLDKCIAGAPQNDFNSEPIQVAVNAGLGLRYKLSNKLALFAESGVTHYLASNSDWETMRSQKPTRLNLLCGVRMRY